tara:strand:+ start:6585 stop:6812 length:228 start_codon:yes stop_codon:yes gene_type:complete
VPRRVIYKSISVNEDTYRKIVEIAQNERRKIAQQLALMIDEEHRKMVTGVEPQPLKPQIYAAHSNSGLSSVVIDE